MAKAADIALEFLFRLRVTLVLVGVHILGKLTISAANLVVRRASFHAENSIKIVIHGA